MMKRTISLLLSLAMVLSLMPANFHAFAEEIPAEEMVAEAPVETTPEETFAIEETVPEEEAESYDAYGTILLSGRCGDNLSWNLYSHGELVISGWGPMDDYTHNTMPWNIADNRSKIKTITIDHGVTSIGNYAFAACPNLTSVTMPSTVTSIGNAAFNNCTSLYVLDIGKNVATIGMSAFSNCTSLTQVTLGESLTSIGDYAFDSTRMMDLVFPETLTSIGSWVFLNCYSLKYLSFKGNAPSFGSGTFSHFYGQVFYHTNDSTWTENVRQNYGGEVEWIASDPLIISKGTCGRYAEWVLTEDGLLTISGTGAMNDYPLGYIPWNEHQRDIKNVAIEKGITGIGLYAFRNCSYLTSLVVPESVTNISASAFEYSSIREITFEGDAPTFGENAFKGKVITVHYPANNATWTEEVRQNYGGTITWVADEVTVAEGTCGDNLTWKLTESGTLTISGQGRMQLYDTTTAPWYVYKHLIEKVIIEDGVTSIGYGAFFYCTDMTSVEIPDSVTVIDPFAFQMCESLTEVQFPETLTTIGRAAFSMCKSLTSVTIPDSATRVEEAAFIGCEALTDVTIGKGVSYLCGTAFARCSGLTEFKISPENAYYCVDEDGVLFNMGKTYLVTWPAGKSGAYTVPDTVAEIGYWAFESCTGLTSVTIPASVEQIDESAFYNTGLKEVHFEGDAPELVATYVGDHYWFRHYVGLTLPVYYPADNATWTDEAKAAFNESTLKWVAYEEETYLAKGTCGENLKWTLTEDGVLTISGTGAMTDYVTASESPWCDYRTSITKVVLGDGVTSVGDRAFYNCTALTDVTIGNKVATIGGYAFRGCTALVSVTIPASVTEIKGSAFRTCSALEEVTFLGNAPTMGTYVFTDCHENLTLNCYEGSTGFDVAPWTDWKVVVNHVGQWIVDKEATCTTDGSRHIDCAYCGTIITEIIVGSHNYVDGICSVCNEVKLIASGEFRNGGWKLDIFGTLTIYGTGVMDDKPWRSYEEDIVHVIIEDGITDITPHAFQGCTNLVDIIIPDSVTRIQCYAFEGCSSLREVDIPEGVLEIENDTFMHCTSLTRVSIPESVTIIDSNAFDGCSSLADVTIPESVETIELYAFRNCSSLAELVIPETVTSIGYAAFYGCTGLVNVTIPNSVTSLGDSVFQGCTSLTRVDIPDSVTSLGASAFKECSGLTQVTIGKGLTEIGAYTFSHCRNLAAIVIPEGVTSIGNYAFAYNEALEEVTFGKSVTTIGTRAFGSTNLTSVVIPDSVTSLGMYVFAYCSNLTDVVIGDGVTAIPERAFEACNNLKYLTIGKGVTSIGASIFGYDGGQALTDVYIKDPSAWCKISFESHPMAYADHLHILDENGEEVTEVVLEDSVTTIPTLAFRGAAITSITIPTSVTGIGSSAFGGCSSLTKLYISDLAAWLNLPLEYNSSHPFYASTLVNGSNQLYLNGEPVTELVIPENVTEIGSYAFYGCNDLTGVVIPEAVTNIGERAFYGCSGLTNVTIGENVTKIGNYAFSECASLGDITIAYGVTEIGIGAFSGCTSLTDIVIPDSVNRIGGYALAGCSSLESVTIPFVGLEPASENTTQYTFGFLFSATSFEGGVKVTQYYNSSFATTNGSLWNAYLPTTLKSVTVTGGPIVHHAFQNCSMLAEIVLPEDITYIGIGAFTGCSNLKSIQIPASVTHIYRGAFDTTLEDVYITDPNAWCNIVLENEYANPMSCAERLHVLDENGAEVTELVLDSTVTAIPDYGFQGASIVSVQISDSVTTIGDWAFHNCKDLAVVEIPESVTEIGEYAFTGCGSLTEVHFAGNAPAINGYAFTKVTTTAYYPAGNETWTEAVRQNYGGKITWKLYCPDEHTEVVDKAVEATCTTDGLTEGKHCSVCDEVIVAQKVVPAKGHTEVVDKAVEATCTTDGLTEGKHCSVCDEVIVAQKVVPAKGHTEVVDKAVEATCTTDGLTEGKHCSVCNEVIVAQEVVPALGHSTVEVPGVEPTVDATGNIPHFSCEVCGKLFAEAEAETELKPEDVVLDKLPCGAMVGGSHYGTVEQALAAAKPGDVVTLTADAVAGNLFVPVGVTLDLAEYSLTADYLFGVKGTFLTGTPEKAKLMVPKDNVILAQDGYVNAKGQYVLPIWDPASNCFQFSLFVVNTDTSKNRGLKINEAAEEIRFQFKHQATSNLNSLLLADGASDNEMSIVIRLSWTNDQGTAHQDFVYNDNQVAKVTGSYDYTFVLTGYSALNINLDTLVVQAMVITNSGATAFGTAWTQQMLK